jgi:hypothetical protein
VTGKMAGVEEQTLRADTKVGRRLRDERKTGDA